MSAQPTPNPFQGGNKERLISDVALLLRFSLAIDFLLSEFYLPTFSTIYLSSSSMLSGGKASIIL